MCQCVPVFVSVGVSLGWGRGGEGCRSDVGGWWGDVWYVLTDRHSYPLRNIHWPSESVQGPLTCTAAIQPFGVWDPKGQGSI